MNDETRRRNIRMGLLLAAVALVLFFGMIYRTQALMA
jgi:hypothetical protein